MSEIENLNVTDIFGADVFNDTVMQARLPKGVYKKLHKIQAEGGELDLATADVIAEAMKNWAIEQGATHYTHWFQPLTGSTAEKHDSFISAPLPDGSVLMHLSGKELIKGEPDASSFPSGGLRATFEARGYTIWDCTSPAFVRHDETGAILVIPTAFCSYTGEALDKKTPLLRSMDTISSAAIRLLRMFGNTTSKSVRPSVGAEQEYFIVDREKYLERKDLIFAGRTLFGAMPPKGQELDDHYFGHIRPRIGAFMKDVNEELWKLGVPAKTQHNEVAPAQHELAPIYEEANVAVDHNQLVMQVLKRVATRHGLRCLLHEKPFAGVNGSGKHNNWSLTTDDGINLLNPGSNPHKDLQFQLVLACILKAVDVHADLLRESASDVGNDHRLGANEAPPAIISIFLGEQLEDLMDQIIKTGSAESSKKVDTLVTGVGSLNDISKDVTDRNRTSPFAFTGNKFEFRMVGSRDSIASPNTVLNAIVAEAFNEACDELEKADDFETACKALIRKLMTDHQRIVFNGNGYSDEWVAEAEKRGLPNIRSMVDAIPALVTDKAVKLFGDAHIYSKAELESRVEILYEAYIKAINIESLTMQQMASKQLIPAIVSYTGMMAGDINSLEAAGADASVQKELLDKASGYLKEAYAALKSLDEITKKAQAMEDGREKAVAYRDEVIPAMAALRAPIDAAELIVDEDMWPVPTYSELLFEV